MSRSTPFLWPKPRLIWGYGIAVLSVSGALIISRVPGLRLESAPVSLFLCAVMLSAWFGGIGPGLLATTLSDLAFYYYFLAPTHLLVAKPEELPRLVIFTVSALLVGILSAAQRSATESARRARDDLKGTVEELQKTNKALDAESRERKHAEETMRQVQAELARVSRVTTMGELTASLAHEVNQPIAAAVTDASTCLRWLMREQPNLTEAREAASRVAKDATRAAEIINRIRQLFRKTAPQRELVDVNEVVQEMMAIVRSEAARYNILLETDLAADLMQVTADRVQLQQVLMNLLMNGIEAMKNTNRMRRLMIKSRLENERVFVSVNDTGVGLPPEHADQIFTAFFTTKLHGTGMGLRISRSIVESHGGSLWAEKNSPSGATFCFTLPTKTEAHE